MSVMDTSSSWFSQDDDGAADGASPWAGAVPAAGQESSPSFFTSSYGPPGYLDQGRQDPPLLYGDLHEGYDADDAAWNDGLADSGQEAG